MGGSCPAGALSGRCREPSASTSRLQPLARAAPCRASRLSGSRPARRSSSTGWPVNSSTPGGGFCEERRDVFWRSNRKMAVCQLALADPQVRGCADQDSLHRRLAELARQLEHSGCLTACAAERHEDGRPRRSTSRRSALLSSMILPQAEADLGPGQDGLQHAAADCQRFIGEIMDVAGVGARVEIADFKTAADL